MLTPRRETASLLQQSRDATDQDRAHLGAPCPDMLPRRAGLPLDAASRPYPNALSGAAGEFCRGTIAVCLAPVSEEAVLKAIRTLRMAPLMTGARGQDERAVMALAEVVAAISLSCADPEIDIEVNPLILYQDTYEIPDVRALRNRKQVD